MPLEDFVKTSPDVQLADELFVKEGEHVVDTFAGRVYRRRARATVATEENKSG